MCNKTINAACIEAMAYYISSCFWSTFYFRLSWRVVTGKNLNCSCFYFSRVILVILVKLESQALQGFRWVQVFKRLSVINLSGSIDSAVVRALASHQCVPGSISRFGVICAFPYSASSFFSPGTPGFPLASKTNLRLDFSIASPLQFSLS